ncbi:hypothetical protein KM043_013469 [Ampulex compressa]|nr:hypothetical protein KM043_013469 [Ampulex compressa]
MKIDYITIYSDGRGNLKNLCKHLKRFDHLELIHADLVKSCENLQNVLDNQNTVGFNATHAHVSFSNQTCNADNIDPQIVKKIHKGLCIIVNQIRFSGNKYETRYGTAVDCANLKKTFAGFGFKVCIYENLKKKEFLSKIENIPKDFNTDYDCLFLCLLSHGCKGSIITSDEEEIAIDVIENKICCSELTNVIKIVIVQACQGTVMGQIQDTLATDGPSISNVTDIASYRNFCIFMSTIPGFVSVRHMMQGSWFIQEFCEILQRRGNNMTFTEIAQQIIGSVEQKRGKMYGADSIAQLPELRSYRLSVDFRLPKYSPVSEAIINSV